MPNDPQASTNARGLHVDQQYLSAVMGKLQAEGWAPTAHVTETSSAESDWPTAVRFQVTIHTSNAARVTALNNEVEQLQSRGWIT